MGKTQFRLIIAAVACLLPVDASAAWKALSVEHATIVHEAGEETRASETGTLVSREYRRVSQALGLSGRQGLPALTVYLCGSDATFRSLTGGMVPDWGGACAIPARQTIVLRPRGDSRVSAGSVLAHELSHVFLHAAAASRPVPRWFDEGVAMLVSGEWAFRQRISLAWSFVFGGGPIRFAEIDRVLSFGSTKASDAYDQSMAALMYLMKLAGPDSPSRVIAGLSDGMGFDDAIESATGLTPQEFEGRWRNHAKRIYRPITLVVEDMNLWLFLCLLLPFLYLAKRARDRRTIKRWESEEEFEP